MDLAGVEQFRRDGFLAIADLADAATVAAIGAVNDDMLAGAIDVSATDNPLAASPLSAGGATVHTAATPHFSSGNRTADRRRRASIFNFASGRRARSGAA